VKPSLERSMLFWLAKSLVIIVVCIARCMTYKTGFGLDGWIYCTLCITRDCRQYSAIADIYTSHFAVTHSLGFSLFTSRVLATDLYNSFIVTSNHTWSLLSTG
jgi:hypothetical protein